MPTSPPLTPRRSARSVITQVIRCSCGSRAVHCSFLRLWKLPFSFRPRCAPIAGCLGILFSYCDCYNAPSCSQKWPVLDDQFYGHATHSTQFFAASVSLPRLSGKSFPVDRQHIGFLAASLGPREESAHFRSSTNSC